MSGVQLPQTLWDKGWADMPRFGPWKPELPYRNVFLSIDFVRSLGWWISGLTIKLFGLTQGILTKMGQGSLLRAAQPVDMSRPDVSWGQPQAGSLASTGNRHTFPGLHPSNANLLLPFSLWHTGLPGFQCSSHSPPKSCKTMCHHPK